MKKTFADFGTFEDCTFCPSYDPTRRISGVFFRDERPEEFHDGDGVIGDVSVADLKTQEDIEGLVLRAEFDTSAAALASVRTANRN